MRTSFLRRFESKGDGGKKLIGRGDKLIADAIAPLWNKAKNGVKVTKGMSISCTSCGVGQYGDSGAVYIGTRGRGARAEWDKANQSLAHLSTVIRYSANGVQTANR